MNKHHFCQHTTYLTVPFFDVDGMEIVWHGNYIKYLEIARCEFLDSIDYNYIKMREEGFIWPIVKLELKYIKPAHFGQKLRIDLIVIEYESCLKINYQISDVDNHIILTQAMTMQVPIALTTGETQFETPDSWRLAIQQAANFIPYPQ